MRLPHTRNSWPIWSMLAAALALLTVSLVGSGTPEEGRLVRMGRNAQRLEAADGIPHSHEQDEPDVVLSGLVVDWAVPSSQALGAVHAAPPGEGWRAQAPRRASTSHPVWSIHTPALVGAPPGSAVRPTPPADTHPRALLIVSPSLGRAPPSA